jgi:hypothetical protein
MEVAMPTKRLRLNKAESQEHHASLLWLKSIGIPISSVGDLSRGPKPLSLYQVDHELAYIRDLPGAGFALALPAELLVITGGTFIMRHEMTIPWYPFPLELSDPEASAHYDDIVGGSIPFPPKILNGYLTGELPLRRGRTEGMIIGFGRNSVPPRYHDYTKVPIELCLWDEREKFWFNFEARVDRGLKVACERRERAHRRRGYKRQPIFKREDAEKPIEGSFSDVPRDETDEPIGV